MRTFVHVLNSYCTLAFTIVYFFELSTMILSLILLCLPRHRSHLIFSSSSTHRSVGHTLIVPSQACGRSHGDACLGTGYVDHGSMYELGLEIDRGGFSPECLCYSLHFHALRFLWSGNLIFTESALLHSVNTLCLGIAGMKVSHGTGMRSLAAHCFLRPSLNSYPSTICKPGLPWWLRW